MPTIILSELFDRFKIFEFECVSQIRKKKEKVEESENFFKLCHIEIENFI